MAKRFTLIDGVLFYSLRSPPVRVPRSREEVNAVLQQFHDNAGHYGHSACFKAMVRHYYWYSMSRDLSCWISRCPTCANRSKRKWLRCSIMTCTNCCGPVERKLGLTFHNFPMDSPSLLARWLKAAGRPNWYPHLWSSVCSVHFTDDCFDRSGGREVLKADAVPTVKTHGDEAIQNLNEGQTSAEADDDQEDAFFAKYDAVELYISTRTYPPGFTYVEKNTFRRFCKKYFVKDGVLHIRVRERAVPVLRNRQQVNEALKEYHDELNHLEFKKCLRLLNERCNWRTMRSDITLWISKCLVCQLKNKPKNPPAPKRDAEKKQRPQRDTQRTLSDSEENDNFSNQQESDEIKVQKVKPQKPVQVRSMVQTQTSDQSQNQVQTRAGTQVQQPNLKNQTPVQSPVQSPVQCPVQPQLQTQVQIQTPIQSQVQVPIQSQVQVPILLHLGPPLNLQSGGPILLTAAQNTLMAQIWGQGQNPTSANVKGAQGKLGKPSKKEKAEIHMEALHYQHEEQVQTSKQPVLRMQRVEQPVLRVQRVEGSHPEVIPVSVCDTNTHTTAHKQHVQSPQRRTHSSRGRPLKRKIFPAEESPKKRAQSVSAEPSVASKPGPEPPGPEPPGPEPPGPEPPGPEPPGPESPGPEPVTEEPQSHTEQNKNAVSATPVVSERPLEARVVVQQCSSARVKTRAGVDGAEAQFAQIGEGLVVYVCFFEGATDETTRRIADSVMNTRFFRSSLRRQLSVMDVPGGVLLVPQDSLGSRPGPRRSMQSGGVSEAWLGKRLFTSLVRHCGELLRARATEGGAVEQGLYGQRQEMEITTTEPMSHVLEF
ncbi:D-aminoacyl-tRNA deacylase 2 [Eucyclogobius newberryi]|uniref:D-aminoacyl-tRNA deacylase 2 n=1 Tax=Eucyclogobius newberryi TaxID=166745 RepID=UPI003B5ACB06